MAHSTQLMNVNTLSLYRCVSVYIIIPYIIFRSVNRCCMLKLKHGIEAIDSMYTKKYSIAISCIILQSMLLRNTTHIIIRIQTLHYQSLQYMKARVIPPNKNVQVRQVGAGGPLPPSIAFAHSCWTRNGIAWKEPELQLAEAFLGSAT